MFLFVSFHRSFQGTETFPGVFSPLSKRENNLCMALWCILNNTVQIGWTTYHHVDIHNHFHARRQSSFYVVFVWLWASAGDCVTVPSGHTAVLLWQGSFRVEVMHLWLGWGPCASQGSPRTRLHQVEHWLYQRDRIRGFSVGLGDTCYSQGFRPVSYVLKLGKKSHVEFQQGLQELFLSTVTKVPAHFGTVGFLYKHF